MPSLHKRLQFSRFNLLPSSQLAYIHSRHPLQHHVNTCMAFIIESRYITALQFCCTVLYLCMSCLCIEDFYTHPKSSGDGQNGKENKNTSNHHYALAIPRKVHNVNTRLTAFSPSPIFLTTSSLHHFIHSFPCDSCSFLQRT